MEKGWNQIETLDTRERDQRAVVRDDRHSELLEGVDFPLELVSVELKVRNALLRGVPNKLLAFLAE